MYIYIGIVTFCYDFTVLNPLFSHVKTNNNCRSLKRNGSKRLGVTTLVQLILYYNLSDHDIEEKELLFILCERSHTLFTIKVTINHSVV